MPYKLNPITGKFDYYEVGSDIATILKTKVVNKTSPAVTLSKAAYQVCLISGATGQRLSVKLAKADSDVNSAGTLGVASETILHNQEGYITSVGIIEDINTTGSLQGETWLDGDILYLSPTTFGAITNVKPVAPDHMVIVGYVEYSHAIHGKIYVKIDNGYELDELHNVAINSGTLANNQGLFYTSATQVWENKTVATALGYTPASASRNLTVNGTTQDLSVDRTFTVTDANLSTSDITTNNVSILKHGFVPKAPNNTSQFLRGDGTWATVSASDPAGWTYIVKSANQDVTNNATLQDDTEFQFSVVAGGHYMIELHIVFSANNSAGNYRYGLVVSSGIMKGGGNYLATQSTGGFVSGLINANSTASTNLITSGTLAADIDMLQSININYSFFVSDNGIFKYQFANAIAGAFRTSRTWKGSILKYKRID